MLKEYSTVFRRLLMATDAAVVAAAFYLAYYFRESIAEIYPVSEYLSILPALIFIWIAVLYRMDVYRSFRTKSIINIATIIIKATMICLVILGSLMFIFKLHYVSRTLVILSTGFSGALILAEKIILISILRTMRRNGLNLTRVLVVGTGKRAQKFINSIEYRDDWGLKIVGLVDDDESLRGQIIGNNRVLGVLKDIPDILHSHVVDEVFFVVPRSWLEKIKEAIRYCEVEGLRIHVAVDYFDLEISRAKQTQIQDIPLLTFESTPDKEWQLLGKRIFDIATSAIGMTILSPVMLAIALLIKFDSPGAVFFRQKRNGVNGRKFHFYKFRTMVEDAEERLVELRQYNEMKGPAFKMDNDPRVTPVGKFLRRTSLDELPQLWNVLKGDMSLIGPRPPIPNEVERYDSWQRRRLSMKPGLSCLWQIKGRNKISDFNEWMNLDLEYIDNWSLLLDFKILFKTIPVVFFGTGAK